MEKKKQLSDVSKRVFQLRKSLGLKQASFAERIGVEGGQSTVSKWESGKQVPSIEYATKMAEIAQVEPGYFAGLEQIRQSPLKKTRKYRVVGEIRAGQWRESIEWPPDDQYEVSLPPETGVPPYAMEAFVVRGDSMDMYYPDGSVVYVAGLIRNRLTPENGDHVMVQRADRNGLYEATLKEFVIGSDGRKWLMPRSTNPEFQAPIEHLPNGAVDRDSQETRITGIVQAAFVKPQRRVMA